MFKMFYDQFNYLDGTRREKTRKERFFDELLQGYISHQHEGMIY